MNIIKSFRKVKLLTLPSFLLFTSLSSCSGLGDSFKSSNINQQDNPQSNPSNGQCLVRWFLTNSRDTRMAKNLYTTDYLNQGDIAKPNKTDSIIHPTNPTRYEFIGWNTTPQDPSKGEFEIKDEIIVGNSSSMDIFAVYKIKYDVVFKDDIGTTIISKLEGLNNGDKPIYNGDTPTKEKAPDKAYTYSYTFVGWSTQMQGGQDDTNTYSSDSLPVVDSSKAVNYEITYYARFDLSKTINNYSVTFKNGNSTLQTKTLEYGIKVTYTGSTPTKANTEDDEYVYSYTFVGWSENASDSTNNAISNDNLPVLTKDTTYYALFSIQSEKIIYTLSLSKESIELDTRGSSISAYNDSQSVSIQSETNSELSNFNINNFNIKWSLTDSNDNSFFTLTTSSDLLTATIKAIKSSRKTNLKCELYNKNDSSKLEYSVEIPVYSYSQESSITDISKTEVGTSTISNTSNKKRFNVSYLNSSIFDNCSNYLNTKTDLVVPPKVKVDGVIYEVGEFCYNSVYNGSSLSTVRVVRNAYFPETIYYYTGLISLLSISNYLSFEKSKYDFIIFEKGTLIASDGNYSYFLYEIKNNANYPQSRFFAGTDYYNFPYTKYCFNSSITWDSNQVTYNNSSIWQDYVDYYEANGKPNSSIRENLQNNYLYVTN